MYYEKKIVFKYILEDAWNNSLKSVFITSDTKDNIFFNEKEIPKEIKTIDNEKLNKILKKYLDKIEKIDIEKLPNTGVMDGFINELSFKLNNKWYEYKFYNLGFYSDEEISEDKQLTIIYDFLEELFVLFQKTNKNIADYFVLTAEDEFEDEE